MQVTSSAKLRYVSIPPRKMRLVADMVKGLPVQKALDILNYTPKIAARHLAKTVKSAAANALSTEGTDVVKAEFLKVENIVVDAAPTAKRIRFQSMGRVFRYRKRYCHLTVTLQGDTDDVEVARKPKAKKATTKRGKVSTGDEKTEKPAAKTKTRKSAKKPAAKASAKAEKAEAAEDKPKKSAAKSAPAKEAKEKEDGE